MKCGTDIHVPINMNCINFGDFLSSVLVAFTYYIFSYTFAVVLLAPYASVVVCKRETIPSFLGLPQN